VHIASLGFRTDLMLLTLQGSTVEDRGDHLVVRTPRNPAFWWGNFLLWREPPAPGDVQRWERAFTQALPDADHRTFGVDGTSDRAADRASDAASAGTVDRACDVTSAGTPASTSDVTPASTSDHPSGEATGYDEFVTAGYDVDASAVMTASAVNEPPHPNREATYRALDLADPADRDAALSLQMANAPEREPIGHREFLARKMDSMRALQAQGNGSWFGAFLDGEMRSGMGLVWDGSGLARFQSVDTHPAARGRGLAGTLVHHVSTHAFDQIGATTLVMVADPGYLAIDVYRSVGFAAAESQTALERAPQGAATR
jgi:ribosomal protein S18 acetylase RimI-like enzyme